MVLKVISYGHPTLRQKGARLEKVTPEISKLIDNMLETMKEYHGVGLAAQQVDHALQLAVIDVSAAEDRPSTMEIDGKPVDVNAHMPVILINPEVKHVGEPVKGPEGCLSFPEIYGDISRPESVDVTAMNAKGEKYHFRCGGLLARAVQHETDHLNGVLFIDRMDKETKEKVREEIDTLQAETKLELKKKAKK